MKSCSCFILDNVAYQKLVNGSNGMAKSEVNFLVDGEFEPCITCIEQVCHNIFSFVFLHK